MQIDSISEHFLHISFSLNLISDGLVSEYWGDQKIKEYFEDKRLIKGEIDKHIQKLRGEITRIKSQDRRHYLFQETQALNQVFLYITKRDIDYNNFVKGVTGLELSNGLLTLKGLQDKKAILIKKLKTGNFNPIDYINSNSIANDKILETANKISGELRSRVTKILDHPENDVEIRITRNKPWGAFNTHTKPFRSVVEINVDPKWTPVSLRKLLIHEIWGGHHSELCLKDRLLVEKGWGEHSIVNVYSPSSFISEGIAEAASIMFGIPNSENENVLQREINEYRSLLSSFLTFKYWGENWSKEKVINYFKEMMRDLVPPENYNFKFILDPVYGKYTPFYHFGKILVKNAYEESKDKKKFINTLYTKPISTDNFINGISK